MTNKKAEIVEAVNFVFSECSRLQAQLFSEEPVVPNSPQALEFFYRIPHPTTGWSFQVCGRKAHEKLTHLAFQAGQRAGIHRHVSKELLCTHLARIIVRKFQIEMRSVDITNVERAMSEAARAAAKARANVTHFLPCHLMLSQQPAQFSIGPVKFHSRNSFRSEIAKHIFNERAHLKKERKLLRENLDYFESFGWVACLEVENCDEKTSELIATQTIQSALNCLHLLLGYQHTQKMVVGGPKLKADGPSGLKLTETGLHYSVSLGGPGAGGFDDDWFEMFDRPDYSKALDLCGIAIESIRCPQFDRPLSRRFLDAVDWFGQAVRETSPASKVVKYVTAIERMLMTEEKDDIATTVSERLAAICSGTILPEQSYGSWKNEAKRAYQLRSRLVHGSISPSSEEIYEGVRLGSRLAESSILSMLLAFGEIGMKAEEARSIKLAGWFDGIVNDVEVYERNIESR